MKPEDLTSGEVAVIDRAITWVTRGVRGWRNADDIRQEIWLMMLEKLPRYDPKRSALTTWAYMQAEWFFLTVVQPCRNKHKRPPGEVPLPEDFDGQVTLPAASPDPLAELIARDIEQIIGYTRCERLVVRLLAAGCTMKMAGQAIGISESRVSQMVGGIRARWGANRKREALDV